MGVLFFIVLPLATILISIVLQKLLKSPILVAILVFVVYLILAFTVFTTEFLINAIIYTILAYIAALLTCFIQRVLAERDDEDDWCSCGCNMPNVCGCNNGIYKESITVFSKTFTTIGESSLTKTAKKNKAPNIAMIF